MEDKQDKDFLNDPTESLAIANTKQLLEEFGDMFEETKFDNISMYIEKDTYTEFLPKERFFATSASLATLQGEDIWKIDPKDQELLDSIQKAITLIAIAVGGDGTEFDKDIIINGKKINVTYEPYTPETSEYIIRELNERRELLQKRD